MAYGEIIIKVDTPATRRAYAAGLRMAMEQMDHRIKSHPWWRVWPYFSLRKDLAALADSIRSGANYIEANGPKQVIERAAKDYADLVKRLRTLSESDGPMGAHMIPALEAIVTHWRAQGVNDPEDPAHDQVEAYDLALHCIRAEVNRKERAVAAALEAAAAISDAAISDLTKRLEEARHARFLAGLNEAARIATEFTRQEIDHGASRSEIASVSKSVARCIINVANEYRREALLSRAPASELLQQEQSQRVPEASAKTEE